MRHLTTLAPLLVVAVAAFASKKFVRRGEGEVGDKVAREQNAADTAAKAADATLDAFDRASRRILLQVVLTESEGGFQFDGKDLPDAAKRPIDQVVSQLKQAARNVYIEIEAHTDDAGLADYNERLGLERAGAVQRYLYEKHQIPLHRMSVISYGMSRPEADNKTKEGRALNRRVVIRVLG